MQSIQEKKEGKQYKTLVPEKVIDFLKRQQKQKKDAEEKRESPLENMPRNWFTWMIGDWDGVTKGYYPFNFHLCILIGIKEYILLRALHDLTVNMLSRTMDEDRWNWARLSYADWNDLIGDIFSVPTIRRVLGNIYLQGLILRKRDNRYAWDRVYSWRVNYDHPSLDKDIEEDDDEL